MKRRQEEHGKRFPNLGLNLIVSYRLMAVIAQSPLKHLCKVGHAIFISSF